MFLQYFFLFTVFFLILFIVRKEFRKIFIKKYPGAVVLLTEEMFFEQFVSIMSQDEKEKNERWQVLVDKAWKTRDFEIDFYWKRANYFWLFQVPAFTAFFAINKTVDDVTKTSKKPDELFVIICLGIVF